MLHVLGIDAGATKTVCLLADGDGRVVSSARAGGANLQAAGELEVEKVLHQVMAEALGHLGVVPRALCLGIAGVDRDEDLELVRGVMKRIGYQARALVVNDALIALVAGVGEAPGIVIVTGTGSIVYGRNAGDVAARAGGWGSVLGDEGSGYWLGRRALRAVVREADGRGQPTRLTPLVLTHFGASRPGDLIRLVQGRHLPPPAIAALAAQVQTACDEGDAVATGLVRAAAGELEDSARSVVERLELTGEAFVWVLAGGLFRAVPRLASELRPRLEARAPRSRVRMLDVEPALGAVRLALAEAHGQTQLPAYRTG